MTLYLQGIIDQILKTIETFINGIMRFIEQNFTIIERINRIINDFLAWLEGLTTF